MKLDLHEWESRDPSSDAQLRGVWLDELRIPSADVEHLNRSGILDARELRSGLAVGSTSYVGRLQLGALEICVRPKIPHVRLSPLMRYAYGLRDLLLFEETLHSLSERGFEDLLIGQLIAETTELMARGLHRRYLRREGEFSIPRGRIDINALAKRGGNPGIATVPCIHHLRLTDGVENRLMLAGLKLAGTITTSPSVRSDLTFLIQQLTDDVSPVPLSGRLLKLYEQQRNRQTAAYEPLVTLVKLLMSGSGVTLVADEAISPASGFMFDMNRFFQALVSRFFHDHLRDVEVRDEQSLGRIIAYVPGANPFNRRAPQPRPDFVLVVSDQPAVVLDAKYRDLSQLPLPREMFYQLALYAMTQTQRRESTILYAAMTSPPDAVLEITDPVNATRRAIVRMRAVNLELLSKLVGAAHTHPRECVAYAQTLAFGKREGRD